MFGWLPDLPRGGWRKVFIGTSGTTFLVVSLALLGTLMVNRVAGEAVTSADVVASIALGGLLTIPIFGTLMVRLQQVHLANEQLSILATYDSLTGALNRRAFIERVENHLYANEYDNGQGQSALLVIDVDHFKVINDRYGHQAGDLALVRIADTVRANIRKSDPFGRLGGEEFGAYLEDVTPAVALRVAEQARKAVNLINFTPEGEEHTLSISIGISLAVPGQDFAALFHEADGRLYAAKRNGRNRVETPEPETAAA